MKTMKHRLSLVGVIASLVAVVALTYVALPGIEAEAGQGAASGLTVNVHVHGESTFDLHGAAENHEDGPFYVEGDLVDEAGDKNGEFHCWGWIPPNGPFNFVSQEYTLFGRGTIQTQGHEGGERMAVVGGTGEFRNVRGEGFFSGIDGGFSVRFQLQG